MIQWRKLGEKYGLAQQDIDSITGWLGSHGFTVGYVYPNLMVIDFSGTAGEIREAFHTEIHHLEVKGKQYFANMSTPQIPRALAPAVVGVVSMNNFRPQAMNKRADYTFSGCTPGRPTSPGTCYALVPADFQTIYNLNPLYQQGNHRYGPDHRGCGGHRYLQHRCSHLPQRFSRQVHGHCHTHSSDPEWWQRLRRSGHQRG